MYRTFKVYLEYEESRYNTHSCYMENCQKGEVKHPRITANYA